MAERLQRSRRKGWRKPPGAVVVGRPSRWGNPFRVGTEVAGVTIDAHEAVRLYRAYLDDALQTERGAHALDLEQLRGRGLLCWCPLTDNNGAPVPCHADVLLELANRPADVTTW